jgi:hypothetical protein
MDTTITWALKIISNPTVSDWRKAYWITVVADEISALKIGNLYGRAKQLEKDLNSALGRK